MGFTEFEKSIRDYDFLSDIETQKSIDNFMRYVYTEISNNEVTPPSKRQKPIVFWIDLFCGAGGTSTGIQFTGVKNMFVASCVNHDENAINSHRANHPHTIHFTEDIKDFRVVQKLKSLIDGLRLQYPGCIINVWASLECTNFSKAKGGQSRDGDSRTLANHMFMYLAMLNPDYFWVENVIEFQAWGPLHGRVVNFKQEMPSGKKEIRKTCKIDYTKDESGKITGIEWDAVPESMKNGKDYLKWVDNVQSMGYKFDWKLLNAADFGAYQSRERLFLQFAKPGFNITWPEQTHTKDASAMDSLFPMEKHKAVKEILDLDVEGDSIFTRKKYYKSINSAKNYLLKGKKAKEMFVEAVNPDASIPVLRINKKSAKDLEKIISHFNGLYGPYVIYREDPLVENTIKRVLAGCKKFVPKGQSEHTVRYNGGGVGTEYKSNSLEGPMGTILSNNTHAIVQTKFGKNVIEIDDSITATKFISQDNGGNPNSKVVDINGPARTVTGSGGKQKLVSTHHLSTYHGNAGLHSIENSSPTVPCKDSVTIIQTDFIDETYGNSECASIDNPAGCLTVNPKLNLIQTKHGYPKFNVVKVERFIIGTSFDGNSCSLDEPSKTILASRKHHYLTNVDFIYNPSHGGNWHTTDKPSPTAIARQDKAPLSRVTHVYGNGVIYIYEDDSPAMVELKEFMAEWGIVDIKMRMLLIKELKKIQGFPEDYILIGTKTKQKKYIGNAVEVTMARALTFKNYETIDYKMSA